MSKRLLGTSGWREEDEEEKEGDQLRPLSPPRTFGETFRHPYFMPERPTAGISRPVSTPTPPPTPVPTPPPHVPTPTRGITFDETKRRGEKIDYGIQRMRQVLEDQTTMRDSEIVKIEEKMSQILGYPSEVATREAEGDWDPMKLPYAQREQKRIDPSTGGPGQKFETFVPKLPLSEEEIESRGEIWRQQYGMPETTDQELLERTLPTFGKPTAIFPRVEGPPRYRVPYGETAGKEMREPVSGPPIPTTIYQWHYDRRSSGKLDYWELDKNGNPWPNTKAGRDSAVAAFYAAYYRDTSPDKDIGPMEEALAAARYLDGIGIQRYEAEQLLKNPLVKEKFTELFPLPQLEAQVGDVLVDVVQEFLGTFWRRSIGGGHAFPNIRGTWGKEFVDVEKYTSEKGFFTEKEWVPLHSLTRPPESIPETPARLLVREVEAAIGIRPQGVGFSMEELTLWDIIFAAMPPGVELVGHAASPGIKATLGMWNAWTKTRGAIVAARLGQPKIALRLIDVPLIEGAAHTLSARIQNYNITVRIPGSVWQVEPGKTANFVIKYESDIDTLLHIIGETRTKPTTAFTKLQKAALKELLSDILESHKGPGQYTEAMIKQAAKQVYSDASSRVSAIVRKAEDAATPRMLGEIWSEAPTDKVAAFNKIQDTKVVQVTPSKFSNRVAKDGVEEIVALQKKGLPTTQAVSATERTYRFTGTRTVTNFSEKTGRALTPSKVNYSSKGTKPITVTATSREEAVQKIRDKITKGIHDPSKVDPLYQDRIISAKAKTPQVQIVGKVRESGLKPGRTISEILDTFDYFEPSAVTPAPTTAAATLVTPKLPKDLLGASPYYRQYRPQFESDVDKALFIVSQVKKKSRRDASYMKWLQDHFPEQTVKEIRALGAEVREHIGEIVKGKPAGPVPIRPSKVAQQDLIFRGLGGVVTEGVPLSTAEIPRGGTVPQVGEEAARTKKGEYLDTYYKEGHPPAHGTLQYPLTAAMEPQEGTVAAFARKERAIATARKSRRFVAATLLDTIRDVRRHIDKALVGKGPVSDRSILPNDPRSTGNIVDPSPLVKFMEATKLREIYQATIGRPRKKIRSAIAKQKLQQESKVVTEEQAAAQIAKASRVISAATGEIEEPWLWRVRTSFLRDWYNKLYPLRKLQERSGIEVQDLAQVVPGSSVWAENLLRKHVRPIFATLDRKLFGGVVTVSDAEYLEEYMVLRRGQELLENARAEGGDVWANFQLPKEVRVARKSFPLKKTDERIQVGLLQLKEHIGPERYQKVTDAAEALYKFNREHVLKPILAEGLISKEMHSILITQHRYYIPFMRKDFVSGGNVIHSITESLDMALSGRQRSGQQVATIDSSHIREMGMYGSDMALHQPLQRLLQQPIFMAKTIFQNRAARSLVEALTEQDSLLLLKNKGAKTHVKWISSPAVKKIIKDANIGGASLGQQGFLDIQRVDGNSVKLPLREVIAEAKADSVDRGTISFLSDGVRYQVEVPAMYAQIAEGIGSDLHHPLLTVVDAISKPLKLGATVWSPVFLIRNIFRDYFSALYREKLLPIEYLRGVLSVVRKDMSFDKAAETGALLPAVMEEMKLTGLMKRPLGGLEVRNPFDALLLPMRLLEMANQTVERGARVAVFKKLQAQGLSSLESAVRSRDATVDFAKSGNIMRIVNHIIPFSNAGVQGLANTIRTGWNNPLHFATMGAVFTTPTLAAAAWNMRFDTSSMIPAYMYTRNWVIQVGEGTRKNGEKFPIYIKIPKGEIASMLTFPAEALVRVAQQKGDRSLVEIFLKHGIEAAKTIAPMDPSIMGVIPMGLQQALRMTLGQKYGGAPIIPQAQKMNVPTKYQRDERTSALASALGRKFGVSPLMIDAGINSYLATGGETANWVLTMALDALGLNKVSKQFGSDITDEELGQRGPVDTLSINPFTRAFFGVKGTEFLLHWWDELNKAKNAGKEGFYRIGEKLVTHGISFPTASSSFNLIPGGTGSSIKLHTREQTKLQRAINDAISPAMKAFLRRPKIAAMTGQEWKDAVNAEKARIKKEVVSEFASLGVIQWNGVDSDMGMYYSQDTLDNVKEILAAKELIDQYDNVGHDFNDNYQSISKRERITWSRLLWEHYLATGDKKTKERLPKELFQLQLELRNRLRRAAPKLDAALVTYRRMVPIPLRRR